MTKDTIFDKVSNNMCCTKKEATELVETVLSIIKDTLDSGENIKISGFGTWKIKQKASRRGRNPQTGEDIILSARKVLTFKPSNLLRNMINR